MRIGILVTNTDNSQFAQSHARDGEKFRRLMRAARQHWIFPAYDCVKGQFPEHAGDCDGYIIGGSPASVHNEFPWIGRLLELIRALDAEQRPVAGCCFGHQAIAKALGGEVGRNPGGGWGFGLAHTQIETPQSWMQPTAREIALYAAHSEQVTALPPGAISWGGSRFCPIGGFVLGRHVMTTEYHPEMTEEFILGLTHAFENEVGREVAEEARRQVREPAHGALFAEWMACFFEAFGNRSGEAAGQLSEGAAVSLDDTASGLTGTDE